MKKVLLFIGFTVVQIILTVLDIVLTPIDILVRLGFGMWVGIKLKIEILEAIKIIFTCWIKSWKEAIKHVNKTYELISEID